MNTVTPVTAPMLHRQLPHRLFLIVTYYLSTIRILFQRTPRPLPHLLPHGCCIDNHPTASLSSSRTIPLTVRIVYQEMLLSLRHPLPLRYCIDNQLTASFSLLHTISLKFVLYCKAPRYHCGTCYHSEVVSTITSLPRSRCLVLSLCQFVLYSNTCRYHWDTRQYTDVLSKNPFIGLFISSFTIQPIFRIGEQLPTLVGDYQDSP